MKTVLTALVVLACFVGSADAGLRSWARREARLQHTRGTGHHQQMPRGARFVGVGTGNTTCQTHGRAAVTVRYKGKIVRVWK